VAVALRRPVTLLMSQDASPLCRAVYDPITYCRTISAEVGAEGMGSGGGLGPAVPLPLYMRSLGGPSRCTKAPPALGALSSGAAKDVKCGCHPAGHSASRDARVHQAPPPCRVVHEFASCVLHCKV
jgi:hypothetical protein